MLNQDVVDFYVRTIDDDWQHAVFNGSFQLGDGPDSPTSIDVTNARFKRGSASIFVATGYPASAYAVVVDSHHTGFSCHEDYLPEVRSSNRCECLRRRRYQLPLDHYW